MKSKTEQKIIITCAGILICTILTLAVVFVVKMNQTVKGDYVQPEFDPSAASADVDSLNSIESFSLLQATESLGVGMQCDVYLVNDKYQVNFYSVDTNTDYLLVKILDESGEKLLGQSGLIKPGEYIEYVDAISVPKKNQNIKIKVYTYETDTYLSKGAFSLNTSFHT